MNASDEWWVLGVRAAGVLHFVTLVAACRTPIPPDWEKHLGALPVIDRRFAVAQNFFIGATIAFCGALCLLVAPDLVAGTPLARATCAGIALWWGGRAIVLGWLRVRPHLASRGLRLGFNLLVAECVCYALAFGWLAVRG